MTQAAGPPPGQQAFASNQMAPLRAPRLRRRWVLELIFILLGSLAMALVLFLFAYGAGLGPTLAMTVLAMIPLLIVGLTVLWIDRWEPEPRVLLFAAFVWGAGVSVLFAGELNASVGLALHGVFGGSMPVEAGPAVFGAPVVEEFFKGLGLLLIFLVRRRHFNGPVDGVVYASVIAAGFAFVENVQYFLMNQEMVGLVFILRGIASPFGHLIYTAIMGLALGWASRKGKFTWLWALPVAYAGSIFLHAAWNGFAMIGAGMFQNEFSFLLAQFALFNWLPLVALGALVVWLRRQEVGVLRDRLGEYLPSGWFAGHEIAMLTSLPARRSARQWARRNGGVRAEKEMKTFQTAATSLAYARQDLHTGHTLIRAREDEMVLLHQVGIARANFRAMIGV